MNNETRNNPVPKGGTVPPKIPKGPTASAKATKVDVTSDDALVFIATRDWRDENGVIDLQLLMIAIHIANYYHRWTGVCRPTIDSIAKTLGLSYSTVSRKVKLLKKHFNLKGGYRGVANEYTLRASREQIRKFRDGEERRYVPLESRINPKDGFCAVPAPTRTRKVLEPVEGELPLIPGAEAFLEEFRTAGHPGEKLKAAGITHHHQNIVLISMLPHKSLEAAAMAVIVADLIHLGSGYGSVVPAHFTKHLGLSARKVSKLNADLLASGWMRIDTDGKSRQNVYTFTPLYLANAKAWKLQRAKTKLNHKGQEVSSGYRPDFVIVEPDLPNILAPHAEQLGLNDLFGVEGMTGTNPASPIGHVYPYDPKAKINTEIQTERIQRKTTSRGLRSKFLDAAAHPGNTVMTRPVFLGHGTDTTLTDAQRDDLVRAFLEPPRTTRAASNSGFTEDLGTGSSSAPTRKARDDYQPSL